MFCSAFGGFKSTLGLKVLISKIYLETVVIPFQRYINLKQFFNLFIRNFNCLKSVRILSFSGPYFLAFGLNTERYSVSLRDSLYLSVFSPNAGKYRPEKVRIRTLFTQCLSFRISLDISSECVVFSRLELKINSKITRWFFVFHFFVFCLKKQKHINKATCGRPT